MEEMDDRRSFLKRMALGAAMIVAAPFVGKAAQVEKVVVKEDFKFPKFKGGSASYTTLSGAGEQKGKFVPWDTFTESEDLVLHHPSDKTWNMPRDISWNIRDGKIQTFVIPGLSFMVLKKELENVMDHYVFEFNDPATRMGVTSKLDAVLERYRQNNEITDYIVKCNLDNNRDRNTSIEAQVSIKGKNGSLILTMVTGYDGLLTVTTEKGWPIKGEEPFLTYESNKSINGTYATPSKPYVMGSAFVALKLRDLQLSLEEHLAETVHNNYSSDRLVAKAVSHLVLEDAVRRGLIEGYDVVCNNSNNCPEIIDTGRMQIDVTVFLKDSRKMANRITICFPGRPYVPS